jgi:hypothetical protein
MKRRRRTAQEKLIEALDVLLRLTHSRRGRAYLLGRLDSASKKGRRKVKRS